GHQVVEGAVLAQCGDDAHADAQHDRQECGGGDQLEGGDHGAGDDVLDRSAGGPGGAHIAGDEVAQPVEVPHDHGLVEIQQVDALLNEYFFIGVCTGS